MPAMAQPTMTAAVAPTYGPPSVFELQQVPIPAVAADQLLVRVRATCVNPADAKQRSGNLKLVMKHAFPLVLGQDFAGVVEQVGARCTRFKVGDEVYGSTAPRNSCSAELVAVYERETQPKPAHLSWNEAAAAPTIVATAYRGVVTHGRAAEGQRVLVLGAAGGVGHVMVQLLRVAAFTLIYQGLLGIGIALDNPCGDDPTDMPGLAFQVFMKDECEAFSAGVDAVAGGVLTELFEDVAFCRAPLRESEVQDMIARLKVSALLDGFRGGPACNRNALVRTILDFSKLALSLAPAANIEINPLLVGEQSCFALDVLVEPLR